MKLRIRVDVGAGPYEVSTTFKDVVKWERKYKRKISTIDTQGIGAEDLAFLAYTATASAGGTVPAVFDNFLDQIVSLEVVEDEPVFPTAEASDAS